MKNLWVHLETPDLYIENEFFIHSSLHQLLNSSSDIGIVQSLPQEDAVYWGMINKSFTMWSWEVVLWDLNGV